MENSGFETSLKRVDCKVKNPFSFRVLQPRLPCAYGSLKLDVEVRTEGCGDGNSQRNVAGRNTGMWRGELANAQG